MKDDEAEKIRTMYEEHHYRCFVCGKSLIGTEGQRAHILGRTKSNYKRYGKFIVDDPLNWLPACSLKCNALIDVGHANLMLTNRIAHLIDHEKGAAVKAEVRDNINRKRRKAGI